MNYDLAAVRVLTHCKDLLPDPKPNQGGLTLGHAQWMLLEISRNKDWSDGKKGRWLGWAQAILCVHGIFHLDEMKEINRACSCEDEGCPEFGTPHIHDTEFQRVIDAASRAQ